MALSSWKTFSYFFKAYPGRGALMVGALGMAGLLEGVGIAALLPLISIVTGEAASDGGVVAEISRSVLEVFHLSPTIGNILLFIVGVMFLKAIVTFLAIWQVSYTSAQVAASLRINYLKALLHVNWLHFVDLRSGSSANALGMEAQRAALSFRQGCQAIAYGMQIIAYGALAFLVSWPMTVAAFLAGLVLIKLLGFMIREARRAGNEMTEGYNKILSLITDTLFGAKPLKAMNKGDHLFNILKADVEALESAQRRNDLVNQSLGILAEPVMIIFVAFGLLGALEYSTVPLPELLFLAVLFLRMVMRIAAAQRSYQVMASHESALWSLLGKTEKAEAFEDDFGGTETPVLEKAVRLENLGFAYDDKPVIKNLNLELPAHQFNVVYGPSGSGKTTLVDLITALVRPDSGEIFLDDRPLSQIDKAKWRSHIGYVPQDVLLFHDTVFNNIALNDPALTRHDVEEALVKAEAADFVSAMENGLDTVVGERGAKLSGGQRQRLAIARAIVHNPLLLIFDEGTSALDKETEENILWTIKNLSDEMTVIAISHTPAMIKAADYAYDLSQSMKEEVVS